MDIMNVYFTRNINGVMKDTRTMLEVYKGSFRNIPDDKLKTWKHYWTVSRPCGSYESGIVNIYKTRAKGVYALVTYCDGSFYPLICYSKLNKELIDGINEYKEYIKTLKKKN